MDSSNKHQQSLDNGVVIQDVPSSAVKGFISVSVLMYALVFIIHPVEIT